jgi:hypothetical protein
MTTAVGSRREEMARVGILVSGANTTVVTFDR